MKISASLYAAAHQDLPSLIHELDELHVDFFHIDCFDDGFDKVAKDLEAIRQLSSTEIDFHAVSSTSAKYIDLAKRLKLEKLTFQYENLEEAFPIIKDRNFDLGLSIVSGTDLSVVDQYQNDIDFLLLMTTTPGKSGGKFNTDNFAKIRAAKKRFPHLKIHVDGGINAEISFILRLLGVDSAVSGSFLINHQNLATGLADLRFHPIKSSFKVVDFMITKSELPILNINNTSFVEAIQKMDAGNLGFVLWENEGRFAGVTSNADIRKGLLQNIDSIEKTSISQIVNSSPISLSAEATTNEMVELLQETNFPILFLPIIGEGNQLVGAITFNSLINHFG